MATKLTKQELTNAYETLRSDSPFQHDNSDKIHHRVLPFATYSPWLTDKDFNEIYQKIKDYTLVDIYRCYELWNLAKQTKNVEGNILEVGVWRGGTGALIAEAVKNYSDKKVYLADTFTGVVKAGENDTTYKGGEHADTSFDMVSNLIKSLGLTSTKILQGIFPEDTADQFEGKISMIHCDVDVYSSTKDIIEWVIPKLSTGSIMVFDDYGFYSCEGVTRFCDDFRSREDFFFVHNLNGHAVFIKK